MGKLAFVFIPTVSSGDPVLAHLCFILSFVDMAPRFGAAKTPRKLEGFRKFIITPQVFDMGSLAFIVTFRVVQAMVGIEILEIGVYRTP